LPSSSRPLLLVNQNFVVMAGLINASKTSATGLQSVCHNFLQIDSDTLKLNLVHPFYGVKRSSVVILPCSGIRYNPNLIDS
jgi:hypothetical protein